MKISRRSFVIHSALGATALAASRLAVAQAQKLAESDPQAQALGYKDDATKVDKAKFPNYAPGQKCAACQLYQAPPTAATGPCAVFQGKLVAGPGWCSSYVKRAA